MTLSPACCVVNQAEFIFRRHQHVRQKKRPRLFSPRRKQKSLEEKCTTTKGILDAKFLDFCLHNSNQRRRRQTKSDLFENSERINHWLYKYISKLTSSSFSLESNNNDSFVTAMQVFVESPKCENEWRKRLDWRKGKKETFFSTSFASFVASESLSPSFLPSLSLSLLVKTRESLPIFTHVRHPCHNHHYASLY